MSINYIDIILIVIFASCVAAGYARGFLLSLISFAKYIVGFPLAFYVADTFSLPFYNKFVSGAALEKISQGLADSANIDSFVASVRDAVGELPFGLSGAVDLSFLNGLSNESAANAVLQNIVEPVALVIIKIILFVITLVLFFILVRLISKAIQNIMSKKHAPLKRTNKFLGAVFGVLKGVVSLAVLSAVLVFLRDFLFASSQSFSSQVDSSAVVEFINKINPLLSLI